MSFFCDVFNYDDCCTTTCKSIPPPPPHLCLAHDAVLLCWVGLCADCCYCMGKIAVPEIKTSALHIETICLIFRISMWSCCFLLLLPVWSLYHPANSMYTLYLDRPPPRVSLNSYIKFGILRFGARMFFFVK